MKTNRKWLIAVGASLGLGMGAAAVLASPGHMQTDGKAGYGQGAHGNQQGGAMGRMQGRHGAMAGSGSADAAHQLMTPEEQATMREKMRSAATPEERQRIALAQRGEMQKRAEAKGITLPEQQGPRGGDRSGSGHKH